MECVGTPVSDSFARLADGLEFHTARTAYTQTMPRRSVLQGFALALASKWCQESLDYASLVPLQSTLIFSLRLLRYA
jgi:hypothetical protein